MDPHYLRLRRRQRFVRALAVVAFFGLLSLPLAYPFRSEIRSAAADAYRYAERELPSVTEPEAPSENAVSNEAAAGTTPTATRISTSQPAPQEVAQAQPAPQRPPGPARRAAKLGDITFRIPEGYLESNADLGSKRDPTITLRALLPALGARAEGRGNCAPKSAGCPDFAIVKLRPARSTLEKAFAKRYKAGPGEFTLVNGVHGLRQIPPHRAMPADGPQFLAQPAGRWVWITCRNFGRPQPKRPTRGVCTLAFDAEGAIAVSVRFDKSKLSTWSAIYTRTEALIAEIRS